MLPWSPLDVDALRLVEWAVGTGQKVVLCPADPLGALSALIAAAVQVSGILADRVPSGHRRPARRVAVVTRSFRTRGTYRGLAVKGGPGVAPELLRHAVPAATHVGRGRVQVLDVAGAGANRLTVFTGRVSDLVSLRPIDLAVVELPVDDAAGILTLDMPVIVVASDPSDPAVIALARELPTYAWSPDDLSDSAPDGGSARVKNMMAGPVVEVVGVPSDVICRNASMFWQDAAPMVKLASLSPTSSELARESFALFHDLIGLALPVEFFEPYAVPTRIRLETIARAARLAKASELREVYLPMVELELKDIAAATAPVPPKSDVLERLLVAHLEENRRVLLVARTSALRAAYATFLEEKGLGGVRVATISGLGEQDPADVAILTGMAPRWARWIYGAGIAPLIQVLGYMPADPRDSEGGEFDETRLIRSAVAYRKAHQHWLTHPAQRADCVNRLCGEKLEGVDDRPWSPAADADAVAIESPPPPPEVPPGLWGGEGWWTTAEAPGHGPDTSLTADAFRTIQAVHMRFEDGRETLLDPESSVTRYLPVSGRSEPGYPVRNLKVGDELVFLDRQSSKDLLAKVIEVADQVPELAVAAGWVSHWRAVLRDAYRRFGTYKDLADALHSYGCHLEDQTIRLWVIGETIGPREHENVRRVGELMDDSPLKTHHGPVCDAMETLRGAHVRLGHRIGDLARSVGPASVAGRMSSDEVIDERSGLTAADFADSIDIVRIVQIEEMVETPANMTGRLIDAVERQ